jgi:hypothetical protein
MLRFTLGSAVMLTAMLITTASHAKTVSGKVPGLHISAVPPGYGHPRVPRVVRGINPKQHVTGPQKDIGLARRR